MVQYFCHFYIQIQNESIQAILKIGNRPVGGRGRQRAIFPFLWNRRRTSCKLHVNWIPLNTHVRFENTQPCLKGAPEPSEKLIRKVVVPIGRFHFYFISVPKQMRPYHPTWYILRTGLSVFKSARR